MFWLKKLKKKKSEQAKKSGAVVGALSRKDRERLIELV